MNNKCNKGSCGCSQTPDELEKARIDKFRQQATKSLDKQSVNERELALEMELKKAKDELESVKEKLAASTQKGFFGVQGFKACAEVSFTPNPEKSE